LVKALVLTSRRRIAAVAGLFLADLLVAGLAQATAAQSTAAAAVAQKTNVRALSASRLAAAKLPASCSAGEALVPRCGDWWGEAVPNSGSDLLQTVALAQLQTHRTLDIVHTYHRWLQAFPTPEEAALARSGHILLINWQPTNPDGGLIPWVSIADGSQDAVIRAEARRLAALGLPVMLSFSHEPEADLGREGSATDFATAYRRVHDIAVAAGATNVVWVWDVEGIATRHWESIYRRLWPGAAYVDWIAWDPYNFASCKSHPWRSFRQLVSPFYAFLAENPFQHRPLMLAELGTVGGQFGSHSKQSWYAGVRSSLASFPRVRALVYFDYPSPPASCDWSSSSTPASAAAFAQLANDPIFLAQSAASVWFRTRAPPDAFP
jgi:hypothetical protein